MGKLLKIAVCIPNEGHTKAESYDSHLIWAIHLGRLSEKSQQENWDEQYEFYWFTAGRMFTAYAREQLALRAISAGMDYIFMCDDDMVIPTDAVERLLKHKVDVVACLAFQRNPPHLPVLYNTVKGYDPVRNAEYAKTESIRNYPKDTLVECDAVGFGGVLIDCKVFQKMEQPYFFSTAAAGEDILFCINAREAGFRIFMDTSVKMGHLSNPTVITEDTYENVAAADEFRRVYGTYQRGDYYANSDVEGRNAAGISADSGHPDSNLEQPEPAEASTDQPVAQ